MSGKQPPSAATPIDPIEALDRAWRERGAQAVATLREFDPGAYVRLLAGLVLDVADED